MADVGWTRWMGQRTPILAFSDHRSMEGGKCQRGQGAHAVLRITRPACLPLEYPGQGQPPGDESIDKSAQDRHHLDYHIVHACSPQYVGAARAGHQASVVSWYFDILCAPNNAVGVKKPGQARVVRAARAGQWKCSLPAGASSGISACTSSPVGSANSGASQSSQYSVTKRSL